MAMGGYDFDDPVMDLLSVSDDLFETSRAKSLATFLPDCILEKFVLQIKAGDDSSDDSSMTMTQRTPAYDDSYSIIAIFDLCGFTKMAEELKNEMSAELFFTESNPRRNTWTTMRGEDAMGKRGDGHGHPLFSMSVGGSITARGVTNNYKIMKSQCTDVQARYGTEKLRDVIGDFFHALMPLIIGGGGDIIRLAGDALIVMFPMTDQESSTITRVAVDAAMVAIKSIRALDGHDFHGRKVHLRVVLDMGAVTTAIVGSQDCGWQYIVTGEPFSQLHPLLEESGNGDVLVTEKVWEAISHSKKCAIQETVTATISTVNTKVGGGGAAAPTTSYKLSCSSGFVGSQRGYIKRDILLEQAKHVVEYDDLRAFVPRSVLHACEAEGSGWFSYIQRVSMVFVKIDVDRSILLGAASSNNSRSGGGGGDSNSGDLLEKLQVIYCLMQEVVYDFGGSIKEFTVDDKGLILMCAMGVPPAMGDNQPEKACLAALKLVDVLQKGAKCNAWVGVSTGMVFTASVGTDRRELVMMGDAVNMTARLMMVAYRTFGGKQGKSGILVSQAAYDDAKFRIEFDYWDTVKVKNREEAIPCYVPIAPLQGGYAIFLPGNFVMVQRYSVNGENVAEVATTCVERLSRGDRGGFLVLQGLPGLGKASLLQGLVDQWNNTFSPNHIRIISCRASNKDKKRIFVGYGGRRIGSGGGGSGGGGIGTVTKDTIKDESKVAAMSQPGMQEPSSSSSPVNIKDGPSSSSSSSSVSPPRIKSGNSDTAASHGGLTEDSWKSTGSGHHRSRTGKTQSSGGEEHPLSSWRPVLVSFLLALKDHVMSYAVACDKAFSNIVDESSLFSDSADSCFGSEDFGNNIFDKNKEQVPFLKRCHSSRGSVRFSSYGCDSSLISGQQALNSTTHSPAAGGSYDDAITMDQLDYSNSSTSKPSSILTDTQDDDNNIETTIMNRRASYPPSVLKVVEHNDNNVGTQRTPVRTRFQKGVNKEDGEKEERSPEPPISKSTSSASLKSSSSHTHRPSMERRILQLPSFGGLSAYRSVKVGSMLNVYGAMGDESLNYKLLDSLNTISREKSAMPMWSHAFGAYPIASPVNGDRSSKDEEVEDTPWARGMFLHFFFDVLMPGHSDVYWLIGDFLCAEMPANIFPNESFRSMGELPIKKFPITLADAIVKVLMLATVKDLIPHMPVSFRAALILDTPNSLCGPNLQLVRRVLSIPELANRFLVVAVSTPLARAEGNMIEEGKLNTVFSKSSKLVHILEELKETYNPSVEEVVPFNGIAVEQHHPLLGDIRSMRMSQNFGLFECCENLSTTDDDAEEKNMEAAAAVLSLSDHSNAKNLLPTCPVGTLQSTSGKMTKSHSSKNLASSYLKIDHPMVEMPRTHSQLSLLVGREDGGKGSSSKSTTNASSRRDLYSLASSTREYDLLSVLVELAELPHLSDESNSIQCLRIAPVGFESCRILSAWSLGVDDLTDEAAVAIFMRTQGVPLYISVYSKLLRALDVRLRGNVEHQVMRSIKSGSLSHKLNNPEGDGGGGSSPTPNSIWGFDAAEAGGLGGTIYRRALSDIRLDGLIRMRSKIEGYLHSLTSQQLNIIKILSCIGGVSHVPLDLFASTYHQFVAVSRDRGLEVDIGILSECGLVTLLSYGGENGNHNKKEWSMRFSYLVVHQVVYWEIPEKMRIAVHKVMLLL